MNGSTVGKNGKTAMTAFEGMDRLMTGMSNLIKYSPRFFFFKYYSIFSSLGLVGFFLFFGKS